MEVLRLRPATLAALAEIRRLGQSKISELVSRLKKPAEPLLRISEVRAELKPFFGERAPSVSQQLITLYATRRINHLSAADLVQSITRTLEQLSEGRWTDGELAEWKALDPVLIELFSLEMIEVASKAIDLAYEYANLFDGARVVTDIRPVFDETASRITAAVISQTLRISYMSGGQDLTLNIALDHEDLKRIRDSCDRAIKKANTARELISQCKLRTAIPGESDD